MSFSEQNLSSLKYLELLLFLGEVSTIKGELNVSTRIFNKLVDFSIKKVKYENVLAFALMSLGEIYSRQAEWEKSRNYINRAKKLYNFQNDYIGLAKCENLMGTIYGDKGNLNKAHKHFDSSLSYLSPKKDKTIYGMIEINLGVVNNGANVESSNNNIYTSQVPTYLMYYGMVDKDSDGYVCRAISTDVDGLVTGQSNQAIYVDVISVETGMNPVILGTGSDFNLRSNTLGGDTIIDQNYSQKELYRIMLKNATSDFAYSETKFRGSLATESSLSTYPSQYYIMLGEQELNSFFIRKGQLQTSNVMNFNSTLTPVDGYSITQNTSANGLQAGNKQYALHIIYIYDRFYIELHDDGFVDSKFDARLF